MKKILIILIILSVLITGCTQITINNENQDTNLADNIEDDLFDFDDLEDELDSLEEINTTDLDF